MSALTDGIVTGSDIGRDSLPGISPSPSRHDGGRWPLWMRLVHAPSNDDARSGGHSGDGPDRRRYPEHVGEDASHQGAHRVSGVPPQPIDADRRCPPRGVGDGWKVTRDVWERSAPTECSRSRSRYLRRWPKRVPDRRIRCSKPFPSFLDVSRSFAGQMRDDRGQRFEANAGSWSSHASGRWSRPSV